LADDSGFFWGKGLRSEAHFMILHHYKETGHLVRDPFASYSFNKAGENSVFRRDFKNTDPDPRARVWSRREDGGHEYFDFAAPEGYVIDSVLLEANVRGMATFSLAMPDPRGWPPRYDLSRRLNKFKFSKGMHKKRISLPGGTEFFSIGSSWGYRWADAPAEYLWGKMTGPGDGRDIAWWQVSFETSLKEKDSSRVSASPRSDEEILKNYAGRDGWSNGYVIRKERAVPYAGNPPMDVYALDWLVYSLDGDIHITLRDNPTVAIKLPVTINTFENEYDPTLLRTPEGALALLWTRGVRDNPIGCFFATTKDFIHWETPSKMVFENPKENIGYTYKSTPLQRTYNVLSIPGRYMMLLAGGFVRYSGDLKTWDAPQRLFHQDGWRSHIIRSRDGRIWVIYANFLREGMKAPLSFPYAICVTSSLDGESWTPTRELVVDQEPSNLWAFPVFDSQIGIVVQYNNIFLKWFVSSDPENFRSLRSPVRLNLTWGQVIEYFSTGRKILCARSALDKREEQDVILVMESEKLNRRFFE
jgi:hypothetical protein